MSKLTLVRDALEVDGTKVQVGTPAWFDWLEHSAVRSFRFDDGTDSFTARRETIKGTDGYWYAYRKNNGKLHKRYIGKTADLSLRRLIEVGGLLNTPSKAREKLPKQISNSEGLSELREARETIRELHSQLGNLQRENEQLRSQLSTPGRDLPEAATLLNQLKAKRKKSTASLTDIEVILDLLDP